MCRTHPHPRRCPGDTGARRRARQNAANAAKRARRLAEAESAHAAGTSAETIATCPDPATTEGFRSVFAAAADQCREEFEARKTRFGDARYEAAVREVGAAVAVRAEAIRRDMLAAENADDAAVARAYQEVGRKVDHLVLDRERAHRVYREYSEAFRNTSGFPSDESITRLADLQEAHSLASRAASDAILAARAENQRINAVRSRVLTESYNTALREAGVSFDRDTASPSVTKLSKKDQEMQRDVLSRFPDHLIEDGEKGNPTSWKRSRRRAHYSALRAQKGRISRHQVPETRIMQDGSVKIDTWDITFVGDTMPEQGAVPYSPDIHEKLLAKVEEINASGEWTVGNYGPLSVHKITVPSGGEFLSVRYKKPHIYMGVKGYTAELTFNDMTSMAHEYGHRVEVSSPGVSTACKAFLYRRTEGLEKEVYCGKGDKTEWTIPDGFTDRYIGKDYPNSAHTEVFSMGMEALLCGEYGGLSGEQPVDVCAGPAEKRIGPTPDIEHRDLILGLLSGAWKDKE